MFFLLRMAFWLGLVLILLPSGGGHRGAATGGVDASAAVSAAGAAVHDAEGFCSREPNACAVGSKLAVIMAERARAGATMLYHFLSQAAAPNGGGSSGSGIATRRSATRPQSEDTLTPTDLAPTWRGTAPRAALPRQEQASIRHQTKA
jgi:Family of unknown function (DUF5330)